MLYNHFTEKLLGLQGVIITYVEENENNIKIYCQLERKEHHCKSCGTATLAIHDYRTQEIKDIPAFGVYDNLKLVQKSYHSNLKLVHLRWIKKRFMLKFKGCLINIKF